MTQPIDELASVTGVYRLLGRLWLREVDEYLLDDLSKSPLCDLFSAAGGSLPATRDSATIEELSVDYCQLFLGPSKHFPPFQSVWQRDRFESDLAESVRQYAEAVGYESQVPMFDHLGVELDLMGRLVEAELTLQPGDAPDLRVASNFFRMHLCWCEPLLASAVTRAETDFYRSLIEVTHQFLRLESEFWSAAVAQPSAADASERGASGPA